jgi:hypothetical protein
MDLNLERSLRLHTEPDHKNLYKWAIKEIEADGKTIGLDQIPWEWSLYFTATSCVLSDSIETHRPLNFKLKVTNEDGTVTERKSDGKETVHRRQTIVVHLRSGDARRNYTRRDPTTFKMFGTDRVIKDFRLDIVQLTDPAEQEGCTAWGCPSYTSEGPDFGDETTEDCIVFYLAVTPEAFARYVAKINAGSVDEIVFRVSHVDGFYADWNPTILTDRVKVLTREREHKVTIPSGYEHEPPRLGPVGEVALFINRKLEFGSEALDAEDESAEPAPNMRASGDQKILRLLTSLRRAGWVIAWLLALILIVLLLRR